jgi:hypothetical protein
VVPGQEVLQIQVVALRRRRNALVGVDVQDLLGGGI